MVDISNKTKSVSETHTELSILSNVINTSNLTTDRKEILSIGISIAKSSYKFWAPTELGGDDNERRIRCYLDNEIESRRAWGEWFAKTATADIIGGLSGAGRTAYLLAAGPGGWGGVLGAGLFSAIFNSHRDNVLALINLLYEN